MTLENYLLKNLDKLIYLATEQGSSWIVIENSDKILANLEKIDKELLRRREADLNTTENKTNSLPYDICKVLDKNPISKSDVEKKEKELESLEHSYKDAVIRKYKLKEIINKWKEPSKRKVVRTYPVTDTGYPGIGVIISGSDDGNLWFYNEKGRKKII